MLWCNVGFAFDLADKRILGKDVKPHIIFRCHDVNDTNIQKTIGLTPVHYQDVIYYVVSYSKDGGDSFFAGESLLFPTDKNHDGMNVWFNVFKHNNYTGVWYNYLGSSHRLHDLSQEWLTQGIVAINPINDDKIPQRSKKVFDSKKINKLIDDLNTIQKNTSITKVMPRTRSIDPVHYLKIIVDLNKPLYLIFEEIVKILDERVDGFGGGEHWTNKELCKKIN